MVNQEVKYIIVNDYKDQAVQNWTFADKKRIIYCNSAEWAMKFTDADAAKRTVKYLKKNFLVKDLAVVKATFQSNVRFETVR